MKKQKRLIDYQREPLRHILNLFCEFKIFKTVFVELENLKRKYIL